MIQEIFKNIYKIEIPIFNSPLKALNSYVIKGLERSLIIDTGLNQEECMNAMQAGLREIGVDLRETDFFITHIHPDHIGLVPGSLQTRREYTLTSLKPIGFVRVSTGMSLFPWPVPMVFQRKNFRWLFRSNMVSNLSQIGISLSIF